MVLEPANLFLEECSSENELLLELGPFFALQLKHVKQINYWDVSGGYHAGKDWAFHGDLCEGFCVND